MSVPVTDSDRQALFRRALIRNQIPYPTGFRSASSLVNSLHTFFQFYFRHVANLASYVLY